MPTRTPVTGWSLSAMISRTRSAAASVRDMIFRGITSLYRLLPIYRPKRSGLPPVQSDLSLFAHPFRAPRRVVDHVHRHILDALDAERRGFHPARHFPGHGAARRGQGHVDRELPVVIEVDL